MLKHMSASAMCYYIIQQCVTCPAFDEKHVGIVFVEHGCWQLRFKSSHDEDTALYKGPGTKYMCPCKINNMYRN